MPKRKPHKISQQNSPGLWAFLFESHVSWAVILMNIAVYVFIQRMGQIPEQLILYPGNLLAGNYGCLVTSGFIHRNGMHLFLNMLGVFIFARIVERHLGILKTFFVYMGALILSMLFSTGVYVFILQKNVAIIGASGAVMGLIATAMLLDPFCITYEMVFPLPVMVKGWMFLYADVKGFLSGESDGVSHLAHLCGFISVAFLVYFLSKRDKRLMRTGLLINIISFIAFLFIRAWLTPLLKDGRL